MSNLSCRAAAVLTLPRQPDRAARVRTQAGAVTAEAAIILPILAIFTIGLAWLVSLGVVQIKAQDAAREAARVVARGESAAAGTAVADQVASAGSTVRINTGSGVVVAEVRSPMRGPGAFFGFLPAFVVHARSVAATEAEQP